MYNKYLLTPLSRWYHPKSGGYYTVIGLALCSTNGREEESVVYWSDKYQGLRYREVSEFLDGRFVLLSENNVPYQR